MSSVKQKLSINSLGKKCQASRDLEKGLSNSNVTEQYGIPRNTILTWVKNKSKKTNLLHWNNHRIKEKN